MQQIKKKLEDVLKKLDYLYTQLLNGKVRNTSIQIALLLFQCFSCPVHWYVDIFKFFVMSRALVCQSFSVFCLVTKSVIRVRSELKRNLKFYQLFPLILVPG